MCRQFVLWSQKLLGLCVFKCNMFVFLNYFTQVLTKTSRNSFLLCRMLNKTSARHIYMTKQTFGNYSQFYSNAEKFTKIANAKSDNTRYCFYYKADINLVAKNRPTWETCILFTLGCFPRIFSRTNCWRSKRLQVKAVGGKQRTRDGLKQQGNMEVSRFRKISQFISCYIVSHVVYSRGKPFLDSCKRLPVERRNVRLLRWNNWVGSSNWTSFKLVGQR